MTDTDPNPGVRGHTRSTWRDTTHLRGMLLDLIKKNPKATREEIEVMYLARTKKIPALVEEALRRAFDNDWESIHKPNREPKKRVDISEGKIKEAAERLKRIILLDLIMPNGKMLRDCTGAEVRKIPGWYRKIAKRVKPNEIVGKILTEEEIKAMVPKTRMDKP